MKAPLGHPGRPARRETKATKAIRVLRAPQAQSAQRVQQVRQVHPVLEDRPAPLDRNPREILKGSMAERGQLTVISSDRVDRGVGNLGSPVMQAEVEC